MWHLIGSYVAPNLAEIGFNYLKKYADSSIEKNIITKVKQQIDSQLDTLIKEINKRTIAYFIISIVGLIYLNTNHLYDIKIYFKTSFLIVTLFITLFFIFQTSRSIKGLYYFIEHFDTRVEELIKKEIQESKNESLTNKIGLSISNFNSKDIENIVLAYSTRALFNWIKRHKASILLRVINYSIILLLFDEIIEDLIAI